MSRSTAFPKQAVWKDAWLSPCKRFKLFLRDILQGHFTHVTSILPFHWFLASHYYNHSLFVRGTASRAAERQSYNKEQKARLTQAALEDLIHSRKIPEAQWWDNDTRVCAWMGFHGPNEGIVPAVDTTNSFYSQWRETYLDPCEH